MKRKPGPNDIPLPLWDDESVSSVVVAERTAPTVNEHGTLEGLVDVPRGASVSLGVRAVALAEIMDYYNQANKTRGANLSSGALEKRYGTRGTYKVTTNMSAKASVLSRVASRAFDALTAEGAMVEAGFEVGDTRHARRQLERAMTNQYGPGKAYARDRQKVVRRAQKVADF